MDKNARQREAEPGVSLYARHGRHLYGESPEWGLASAYH
jgi:hypothetical protein